MRLALLLLVTLGVTAKANPVATADAKKVWERCLVAVSRDHAQVSCAIGYSIRSQATDPLFITVPVFVPQSTSKDEFTGMIRARLEFDTGGSAHAPVRYEDRGSDRAPPEMKLVNCVFAFARPPAKVFSIVASYQQPIHEGRFFYLPQFEDGEQRRDSKNYTVTVFPMGDASIDLVAPKAASDKVLTTRITVVPEHQKVISIAVK